MKLSMLSFRRKTLNSMRNPPALQRYARNLRFARFPLHFKGGVAVLLIILCSTFNTSAQTLFTYGKHAVSKDEFLKAYNKNNKDTSGAKISYADYLELYSRFKLK